MSSFCHPFECKTDLRSTRILDLKTLKKELILIIFSWLSHALASMTTGSIETVVDVQSKRDRWGSKFSLQCHTYCVHYIVQYCCISYCTSIDISVKWERKESFLAVLTDDWWRNGGSYEPEKSESSSSSINEMEKGDPRTLAVDRAQFLVTFHLRIQKSWV